MDGVVDVLLEGAIHSIDRSIGKHENDPPEVRRKNECPFHSNANARKFLRTKADFVGRAIEQHMMKTCTLYFLESTAEAFSKCQRNSYSRKTLFRQDSFRLMVIFWGAIERSRKSVGIVRQLHKLGDDALEMKYHFRDKVFSDSTTVGTIGREEQRSGLTLAGSCRNAPTVVVPI
jgi:hypothetical protein